ncbi:lysozyme inhibitor LprI family protein [Azospirillum doebereinerae]|nr:lysozyme inhibitor LprI family protein [Azospirillum doebereinerae]MCG5242105.1 lysozyme inhibitor LprI family protein [Azospirillum doebereinerae]
MMRVLNVFAGVFAGSLAGLLLSGSVLAADCAAIENPTAELACRDAGLTAANEALDGALAALGETTDALGRTAIEAGQTLWRSRRDEACPVAAADLAEPKTAKARTDCLLRATNARVLALEAQRTARSKPVADTPLTITDAAAPRLAPVPARSLAQTRPVSATALVGRWAKADPVNRAPVDDCRTSYLDVTREHGVSLIDPRVPGFPIEAGLTADSDPGQGATLTTANGPVGGLRLEAADTPRRDRLVLTLAPPATFAATFVRCR